MFALQNESSIWSSREFFCIFVYTWFSRRIYTLVLIYYFALSLTQGHKYDSLKENRTYNNFYGLWDLLTIPHVYIKYILDEIHTVARIKYYPKHILLNENHHHHHHVVRLARISLTLSLHVSLSFIASGRSSGLHPYHHIAAVCMFELVVLLLIGHMRGSTGVHHLRSRPFFFSSVRHVWFV